MYIPVVLVVYLYHPLQGREVIVCVYKHSLQMLPLIIDDDNNSVLEPLIDTVFKACVDAVVALLLQSKISH